ncbi:hypothetical protein [Asticcacaulis sp. W401b]|uniref:hypothetical protein n=1 Tax=Asticcacaulis sp. W401b TaxID=3388666 RepID=UPI003970B1BE
MRKLEKEMITLRVSLEMKKRITEKTSLAGISTSDYIKGLIAADLDNESEYYSQRAAMNSHITMLLVGELLANSIGPEELAKKWPIVEEATVASYGVYKPTPKSIIESLKDKPAPLYKRLYDLFVSHNLASKKGK